MVNKMSGKGFLVAVLCNRLANQFLHLARGHSVGPFGNQVHPMRRENGNRCASASSRHCGRWKDIIAAETDFAVNLARNNLLIGSIKESTAYRLKLWRRLTGIEVECELKLVIFTNELSWRADFLIASGENELRNDC